MKNHDGLWLDRRQRRVAAAILLLDEMARNARTAGFAMALKARAWMWSRRYPAVLAAIMAAGLDRRDWRAELRAMGEDAK